MIAIVGATGTGKSALAEALALRCNGEIVSADSMQVYRGMDIGTAKFTESEQLLNYHCIDVAWPGEPFSVAQYQHLARCAIEDITGRGKLPIICGGSGLYIRAALDDFNFAEQNQSDCMLSQNSRLDSNSNLALRQLLQKEAEELGYVAFHAKLAATDPASAALIHPNNVRRVVRAFELLAQGTSYAKASADFSSFRQYYRATYIGIDVKPELLYIVLNNRVDKMLAAGLLSEVQLLLDRGLRDALTAVQAIGYKELVAYLDGEVDLATAVSQIKQATRRYAKRQRSWFKRDSRISWIQADGYYTGYLAGEISGADLTNRLLTDALRLLELQL